MTTLQSRTVRANLTRDDFVLAHDALREPASKPWLPVVAVGAAAAVGFGVAAFAAASLGWDWWLQIPVAMVLALAGAWVVSARLMRQQLATVLRNDGAFLRPFRLTATVDGVVVESDVARTEVSWRGVLGIELTADLVLLRTDGATAVVVPRSAFPDAAAMREFADHLRTLKREGGDVWSVSTTAPTKEDAVS